MLLLSYTGIIQHEQVSLKGNMEKIAHERFGPHLAPNTRKSPTTRPRGHGVTQTQTPFYDSAKARAEQLSNAHRWRKSKSKSKSAKSNPKSTPLRRAAGTAMQSCDRTRMRRSGTGTTRTRAMSLNSDPGERTPTRAGCTASNQPRDTAHNA